MRALASAALSTSLLADSIIRWVDSPWDDGMSEIKIRLTGWRTRRETNVLGYYLKFL